jgi:hypothetical protein
VKKRVKNSVSLLATSRLLDYADQFVTDTLELPEIASLYVELELFRRHFLHENGDTCHKYRLSVLMLTLSRFAASDDATQCNKLSEFLARYTIYQSLFDEIKQIQQHLEP